MTENIQFNVSERLAPGEVDAINNKFYSRFNYPWVPVALPTFEEPLFWATALNNDLCHWDNPRFGDGMKIWVAGCGTNQAVLTALRFPTAEVVGSDVSTESLNTAEAVARQIGLTNLTLREESLNATAYDQQFDYVICTGVIHHNANPAIPLNHLMKGMKKDAVLELMVYNYYHRVQTTAFQKAIRLLGGSPDRPDIDRELPLTMDMVRSFPVDCHMKQFLEHQRDLPEAAVADNLLQPVEYSYTIRSLRALAEASNLRLQSYCVNQFDKLSGNLDWLMRFDSADLQASYDALSDTDQLQVTNLLLAEKSPMLWFYLERSDNPRPALGIGAMNEAFRAGRFVPASTVSRNFILRQQGHYDLSSAPIPCPAPAMPVDSLARQVFQSCDGKRTIAQILQELGLELDRKQMNRLRLQLLSSGYPYLRRATA